MVFVRFLIIVNVFVVVHLLMNYVAHLCVLPFYRALDCPLVASIGDSKENMRYGAIDAVYTWVNGSDPKWKAKKKTYYELHRLSTEVDVVEEGISMSNGENRFRDNEELRYSLRSLEMYAPWIRHVYIVTDGQVPYWLNLEYPRVSVIQHSEIFENVSHLPVFSSPSIESHLDNIPGLSTHFVYFNDDVFLGANVYPEDFVSTSDKQKVYLSWEVPECSKGCHEYWLGDGFCDSACNNTKCDFDQRDCGCVELEDGVVECDDNFEVKVRSVPYRAKKFKWPSDRCFYGCDYKNIGNGECHYSCNNVKCGFDAGDCDEHGYLKLPKAKSRWDKVQMVAVKEIYQSMYIDLNRMFRNGTIRSAHFDGQQQLIKSIRILEKQMALIVVFGINADMHPIVGGGRIQIQGIMKNGTEHNVYYHLLKGKYVMDRAIWTPLNYSANTEYLDDDIFDHKFDLDQVKVDIKELKQTIQVLVNMPMHTIEDWAVPITVTSKFSIEGKNIRFKKTCVPQLGAFQKTMARSKIQLVVHADGKISPLAMEACHLVNGAIQTELILPYNATYIAQQYGIVPGEVCFQAGADTESVIPECANIVLSIGAAIKPIITAPPMEPIGFLNPDIFGASVSVNNYSNTCIERWQYYKCLLHATYDDSIWEPEITIATNKDSFLEPTTEEIELDFTRERNQKLCQARLATQALDMQRQQSLFDKIYTQIQVWIGRIMFAPQQDDLNTTTNGICNVSDDTAFTPNLEANSDDTFGDSLRYVNKLYNRKFGTVVGDRRRVPSHMPHMINLKMMQELKSEFKKEFEETSTHRFRHPKDMQFSFSYFYYVMNRHKLHPNKLRDIWNEYLDTNHDGILDENEIITLASIAHGDSPPKKYIEKVESCLRDKERVTSVAEHFNAQGKVKTVHSLEKHIQYQDLEKCPDIVAKLIANARQTANFELMTEDEITFHMLSDQYHYAWKQLQGTRAKRTKFVCINDDMKYPTSRIKNILRDLFIAFWPKRSAFELPYHYRNSFTTIDEYHKSNQRLFIVFAIAFLVFVVCNVLLMKYFW